MISLVIDLPPEIQLIIQRHYKDLLVRTKFIAIRKKLQHTLYFWMHLEGMYNIDYRSLPFLHFKIFRPRRTPLGIKLLPRAASILIPGTLLLI